MPTAQPARVRWRCTASVRDARVDGCDGFVDDTVCGSRGERCIAGECACPGGVQEADCADGMDNDCDGAIDCADTDCLGQSCGALGRACSAETCTCPGGTTETACGDGQDNDCDGAVDCADSDCPCDAEVCTNGVDDNGDDAV
ncbi:MAG: hypothetical protein AAFX94_09555, partial [Myxococcota bacterium]